MPRCVIAAFALAASVATTGCANDGELSHGHFHYVCSSNSDYSCDGFGEPSLDRTIAVGATFDLEYTADPTDPAVRGMLSVVEPASEEIAEHVAGPSSDGLRIRVPGEAAFLATADDIVVDFIHLNAAEISAVSLVAEGWADGGGVDRADMGMLAGQAQTLTAYPLGALRDPLLGSSACTWSADVDGIVEIPMTNSCRIELRALSAGTTTLRVNMAPAVETELAITVEAQP